MSLSQALKKCNTQITNQYKICRWSQKQVFETPDKKQEDNTAQKSLKKSVMDRISSIKNSVTNKYEGLKKLSVQEMVTQMVSSDQQEQLKELILNNQSTNNPGFYEYTQWIKLHEMYYSDIDKKYTQNLWKILRLINYGEVLIPTGLLYQLMCDIKKNRIGGFQKVINKFLLQNQTLDTIKGFKDLNNYIRLQEIEKAYKGKLTNQKKKKIPDNSNSKSNVFTRVYSQAKIRREKKINGICEAIVQEVRQCYSKPKITKYRSQSFHSLVKPERICQHAQKYKWKNEEQRFFQECQLHGDTEQLFKAKLLDKTIFEGDIYEIPGVVTHLNRNYYSQAEKLRLKRFSERPQYCKKRIY